MATSRPQPAYAHTPSGRVHYVEAGTGEPILLLHQTPRSWDEYRELIPLLAEQRRVVAMDTVGFGASDPVDGEGSIETFAAAAGELLDVLGIGELCVMGHHTGGVIALELAAQRPEQVRDLVLSSTPFVDEAARRRRASRPVVDDVPFHDDGHHLTLLWRQRQRFYPENRPDVLTRFVVDTLRALEARDLAHAVSQAPADAGLTRKLVRTLDIRRSNVYQEAQDEGCQMGK